MSVLVFLENWDGKFKKLSFELVSYASKVAEMLGDQAIALSIGKVEASELEKLAVYGATKVVSIENEMINAFDDQAYTSMIAGAAQQTGAKVLVLSNNNTGKALAPRLSVRLKAGVASGVSKLPLSVNPFVVYKKVYSGKAFANVVIKTDVKILTLAQNSFDLVEAPQAFTFEKLNIQPDENLMKTQVK
jgi:electron transfer flavoprotein alpha subunit